MPQYLLLYVSALWKHWEKRLTGGSLIALATLWALQGNTVYPALGMAVIGATFMAASFGAWREEHVKRAVRAEITGLTIQKIVQDEFIVLDVCLTNLEAPPMSFEPKWTLDVMNGKGERLSTIPGWIKAPQLRPLQWAEQFNVEILFQSVAGAEQPDARFVLTGSDIYGHPVQAKFPKA